MVTVCDVNANCIAMYINEYSCKVNIAAVSSKENYVMTD